MSKESNHNHIEMYRVKVGQRHKYEFYQKDIWCTLTQNKKQTKLLEKGYYPYKSDKSKCH